MKKKAHEIFLQNIITKMYSYHKHSSFFLDVNSFIENLNTFTLIVTL